MSSADQPTEMTSQQYDVTHPGLSREQVEKVNAVWNVIRANQKFHGIHFYQRLMTEYPDYQELFTYFKEKQLDHMIRDRDPRLIVQALRMMLALDTMFINLEKPEKAAEFCYKLGHRHLKYGVRPEHFQVAQSVLINSLSTDLSDTMDVESKEAVNAALDFFIPHIIRGLEYARSGVPLYSDTNVGNKN